MSLTNLPIPELAETYIRHSRTKDESLDLASMEVVDMCAFGPWDRLWEFVQYIANRDEDPGTELLALVAAGPLEDLLSKAGHEYIGPVRDLVLSNPRAARMLTGVWKSDIDPNIWDWVVNFCRAVPDPLDGTYAY